MFWVKVFFVSSVVKWHCFHSVNVPVNPAALCELTCECRCIRIFRGFTVRQTFERSIRWVMTFFQFQCTRSCEVLWFVIFAVISWQERAREVWVWSAWSLRHWYPGQHRRGQGKFLSLTLCPLTILFLSLSVIVFLSSPFLLPPSSSQPPPQIAYSNPCITFCPLSPQCENTCVWTESCTCSF